MSSVSLNKVASKKTGKRRHQPYDSSKRSKANSQHPTPSIIKTTLPSVAETPSTTSTPESQSTRPTKPLHSIRELAMKKIRKHYPYFTPRNDWEVLYLSNAPYSGSEAGLYERLDKFLAVNIQEQGSYDAVVAGATKELDELLDWTGFKPSPGDPEVFVRPLSGSEYSIRLFSGNAESKDYCLDFVLTSTGEPVNSPFKFDLLCLPDPNAPIGLTPIMSMHPLECAFGIPQHEIEPGEEKFLLHDGQHCLLRRPGHRDVRFTVPIRRRLQVEAAPVDADVLAFPEYID
ncbi:uncharacterized protein TRAVEDRAFT_53836 [Trametes versicolor FP-101664 SS1]|uniref:uncharacterized protein n=1 Tax=Trametes versicolor (strain FP-101664) TaxID=717944 RepID=UPI00046225F0|nr:uncharacterized protein TRAVEDRAFT_53836 [Trametes versicolor FP-101664 SS1]EIW52413.1 hypothetical protein TRAVEDRAFT_53836 [Trametes versicolor FP-101664 SS1]